MQIIQFVVGNSIAIGQIIIYSDVIPYFDQFGTIMFVSYSTTLLILFLMFYRNTYGNKSKKNRETQTVIGNKKDK